MTKVLIYVALASAIGVEFVSLYFHDWALAVVMLVLIFGLYGLLSHYD